MTPLQLELTKLLKKSPRARREYSGTNQDFNY